MTGLPPLRREGPTTILPHRLVAAPSMTAIRRHFATRGFVGDDLLPPPILRSWQRCAAFGLRMDMRPTVEPLGRADFGERRERNRRLCAAAADELARLHADGGRSSAVVVLTDADGVLLDRVGEGGFAAAAERIALSPGVVWAEPSTGTNAIGTALAERREITVHGGEHFFESHRGMSCTAAPLFGPHGETLGVLDLSDHAAAGAPSAAGLVRRAVAAVERRLFLEAAAGRRLIALGAAPSALAADTAGLLALDGDRVIAADRCALALLDLEREAIEGRRWTDVFEARRPPGRDVERLSTARGRVCFGRPLVDDAPAVPGFRPSPAPAALRPAAAPRAAHTSRTGGEIVWDEGRRRALARATRLLDADVPVLIQGETGTGKEVFARALHAGGRRADRPFVAVNCAALPEGLIEAELFGYEEGAFTGARRKGSKGLMREADGGVLFLDEIGDMPLALQARLLRALEQREVSPLGGGRAVPVDFTLICATHMGLVEAVERRAFRQDLYFRIAQYTVELEPLRAHPDLRSVVERLWADRAAGTDARLAPETLDRLAAFDWPGNYRQLTATLRTLAILAEPGETLGVETLPADLRRAPPQPRRSPPVAPASGPTAGRVSPTAEAAAEEAEAIDLAGLTRSAMRDALAACGGNVTRAAARLGVHRSTLYRRVLAERAEA